MSSIRYEIFSGKFARAIDIEKLPWPDDAKVIYAFDENDQIIGRIALMNVLHVEGAWIKNDRRNGIVLGRLFEKVEELLKEDNRTSALSFIKEDAKEIIAQMPKANYIQLPYKVFLKPIEG